LPETFMRALLLAAAVLIASPALAQSSPNAYVYESPIGKLECKSYPAYEDVYAAIRRSPDVQAASADRRGFCVFIGAAGQGPWRRYAVAQFGEDPYWCGSAGCQVLIFIEDRQGEWRQAIDPDMPNNAFAKEEGGVAVDISSARDGLPALGIPMYRTGNELDYVLWVFDPKAGEYTWDMPPADD
jgi:hypothetical protein